MSKLLDWLTLAAICLLVGVFATIFLVRRWYRVSVVPVVHAQANSAPGSKTILIDKTRGLDPFEVMQVLEGSSELTAGGLSVQALSWIEPEGTSLTDASRFRSAYYAPAADSWLKDLTLVLRNRTSKTIVRVEFDLTFPETKGTGPMIWPTVRFGQLPANAAFYGSGDPIPPGPEPAILFNPGQVMGFNFARSESHLRAAVETRQPFASISLCYVHFRVSFDDGMVWTEAGDYANPDPQHPGRYLPPDRGYFPGPLMGLPAE